MDPEEGNAAALLKSRSPVDKFCEYGTMMLQIVSAISRERREITYGKQQREGLFHRRFGLWNSWHCGQLHSLVCYFTFVLAILGIVFGVKGRKLAQPDQKGLATAGFVLGIIGTAIGALGIVCIVCAAGVAGAVGTGLLS